MGDKIEEQSQHLLVNGEKDVKKSHDTVVLVTEKTKSKKTREYEKKVKQLLPNGERKQISSLNHDELMKFFDFLIPDWKRRNEKEDFYNLLKKSNVIKNLTRLSMVDEMLMLLKAKDKSIFHQTAYSILIQYCHEVKNDKTHIDFDELMCKTDKINEDYKQFILLIMARFPSGTKKNQECLMLREKLKKDYFPKFKQIFETMITDEKKRFGFFFEVSVKPLASFYYVIASPPNAELILRLFPQLQDNSSIVSSFHEQRNLWIFDSNRKSEKKLKKIYELIVCYRIQKELIKLGLSDNCWKDLEIVVNLMNFIYLCIKRILKLW